MQSSGIESGVSSITHDFSRRADLATNPEYMDGPCSYEELRACLRSIARVNRLTLAYRPVLAWLERLRRTSAFAGRTVHLVDLGCGYGDLLRRVHGWAQRHRVPITLTGIDLNGDAVRAAREATPARTVTFYAGNAFDFDPPGGVDLIVSSLVMHHMETPGIVELLGWMEQTARLGWFISDLHRQPTPYRLFDLLTRLTTWHHFAKHDGLVSIRRSFRHEDWTALLEAAAIPADGYQLRTFRPARLCVAREHATA